MVYCTGFDEDIPIQNGGAEDTKNLTFYCGYENKYSATIQHLI